MCGLGPRAEGDDAGAGQEAGGSRGADEPDPAQVRVWVCVDRVWAGGDRLTRHEAGGKAGAVQVCGVCGRSAGQE